MTIDQQLEIASISPEATWPMRHRVLRPHQKLSDCMYPLDFSPNSIHVGAYLGGNLVGVASAFLEAQVHQTEADSYRLRGMAVEQSLQSKGIGSQLIKQLQNAVAARGGREIWCNARTTASAFYTRHGFVRVGEEFELPGIGPHYLLVHKIPLTTSPK